ncbi:MAG: DUF559 domain-containing protein [Bacteroidales bacterium]|nr:DUF559 domain-containing protein [Bacteroidales bacterium]
MKYKSNIKQLKETRQHLRTHSTSAEAELWKYLKSKQLKGRKFRRQHSIENYIVDFYCSKEKLIIELDGDPHGDYIQIQRDEKRDDRLAKMGYKILRFENRFVFQDIEWVKEEIIKTFSFSGEEERPNQTK